jgi:FixJ family two-component response regulator
VRCYLAGRMSSALNNFCVAIIDDDESFCRSSSRMLRAAGIQSVTYLSGEEFLADPVRWRFACLLVDIQLGGMSGFEMQRQLVAEGNRTPVIFITAHDDPAARAQALHAGSLAMFRKTDDGARLLDALKSLPTNSTRSGARAQ